MARSRVVLLAALLALCACAATGVSTALGAHARGHRASACAKNGRSGKGHRHSRLKRCHKPRIGLAKHRLNRRTGSTNSSTPAHAPATPARGSSAGAGQCADAGLTPTNQNVERVRAAVLCLVNRERASRGMGPLRPNTHLQEAAQRHTESMATQNYFEHVGPSGDTPLGRIRAAGYIYSSHVGYEVGENLGFGTLWLGTPRAIVSAWMASPGHRANILDRRFRDTAIGVSAHPPQSLAHGQSGGIYTQDFGVIITS
jgi:uncharacterized protein YkwD